MNGEFGTIWLKLIKRNTVFKNLQDLFLFLGKVFFQNRIS